MGWSCTLGQSKTYSRLLEWELKNREYPKHGLIFEFSPDDKDFGEGIDMPVSVFENSGAGIKKIGEIKINDQGGAIFYDFATGEESLAFDFLERFNARKAG